MDELLYPWQGELSLWLFCVLASCCFLLRMIQNIRSCWLIQWMIFWCQGSWYFSFYKMWSHQFSFQLLSRVLMFLLQLFCRLCWWHSYFKSTLQKMWEFYKCASCVQWVFIKCFCYILQLFPFFLWVWSYWSYMAYNLLLDWANMAWSLVSRCFSY